MAIILLFLKINILSSLSDFTTCIVASISGLLIYLGLFAVLPDGRAKIHEVKEIILMLTAKMK